MSRYNLTGCCALFGAISALLALSSAAMGNTLLFSDNFNTTTYSTDVNNGIGTPGNGRTAGKYETATYLQNTEQRYYGGSYYSPPIYIGEELYSYSDLRMGNGTTIPYRPFVWLNRNLNGADSVGGLDITFHAYINPTSAPSGSYSSWIALGVGGDAAGSDTTYYPLSGTNAKALTIALRAGTGTKPYKSSPCEIFVWENGASVMITPTPTWSSSAVGDQWHDWLFKIRGVGDNNPFDGSGAVNVKLYVDGGTTEVFSYTTTSAKVWSNNYVALESDAESKTLIDSWSITQIPEPSALALLGCGLIGLLAYAWRRRR